MKEKAEGEETRGLLIGGSITLGIGVLFLLSNLDVIPDFDVLWPIIPIIAGAAMIVGALARTRRGGTG